MNQWMSTVLFIVLMNIAWGQRPEAASADSWIPDPKLKAEAAKLRSAADVQRWIAPGMDALRVDVLRAGLRLKDGPAAIHCAAALEAKHLDSWESERVISLLMPHAFDAEGPVDFGQKLRFIMGSSDIPLLFKSMPASAPWSKKVYLGKIHVVMRSSHAMVAIPYLRSTDRRIRDVAIEAIWSAISYDDVYRDEIAGSLLSVADRAVRQSDGGTGLPSRLVSMLEWTTSPLYKKDLEDLGFRSLRGRLESWTFRWLADESPSTNNEDLLLDVLEWHHKNEGDKEENAARRLSIMSALAKFKTVRTRDALAACESHEDAIVEHARVKSGDTDQIEQLIAWSRYESLVLPLLLESSPSIARGLIRHALGGGVESRRQMLNALEELAINSNWTRIRWDIAELRPLFPVLIQSLSILEDSVVPLVFGTLLPGCARSQLADAVLDQLNDEYAEPSDLAQIWIAFDSNRSDEFGVSRRLVQRTLAFLNVVRPQRFRALLRDWCRHEDPRVKRFAVKTLLKIGDPQAGKEVVDFVKTLRASFGEDSDDLDGHPLDSLLARSGSPAALDYLKERYKKGDASLASVAVAAGLPREAEDGFELLLEFELTKEQLARVEERVFSGDGVGGFAMTLEAIPIEESYRALGVGFVRDSRVKAWLQKLQRRRDLGQYAWATGQLSVMGDTEARAETWRVIRAGRYYWLGVLDEAVLSNGYDPETMPWWIGELRSQCCRISMSRANFPELLGSEISWYSGARRAGMTPYEWATWLYAPNDRRRLVWSRSLGEFMTVDE